MQTNSDVESLTVDSRRVITPGVPSGDDCYAGSMTDGATFKRDALRALRSTLEAELHELTQAQQSTQAGAVHEENRAEDPKDMRSTEVSYLARGLAERVEAMRRTLAHVAALPTGPLPEDATAQPPALVTVTETSGTDERQRTYLLCPVGGGTRLDVGSVEVVVVTPSAPVGSALKDAGVDDEVELPEGGRLSTWVIDRVV